MSEKRMRNENYATFSFGCYLTFGQLACIAFFGSSVSRDDLRETKGQEDRWSNLSGC